MSIRAKKSLGQHFLRSKTAIMQITLAAQLSPGELVLEIGPGEGALTESLLEAGAHIIAVETDPRCITKLIERFSTAIETKQLMLIEGDIREQEIQSLLFSDQYLSKQNYKLVANIPYYITGYLFRLFLEILRQPSLVVFLIQKEVAEQIIARNKKEGLLSLSIKAFGTPHYIAKVKSEAFSPPPKVDSAILSVTTISRDNFRACSEATYFRLLKIGFAARRKMLFGNLVRSGIEKIYLEELFMKLELPKDVRGEDLSCDKWLALATHIHE